MNRLALAAALLASPTALAERPTEGGPWSFDPDDVLATHDLGDLRVHYSVAGPNVAPLADADADAVPDYVARVATTTADALALYTADLGLRPPLPESEVGLELGGSPALDIYLVDFGGAADGLFGVDGCTLAPVRCAGYLVIENDFAGYGYASTAEAVDTVASHEGFHAVQAAYSDDLPLYFSEGTAVWAERAYRPDSRDFLRFCDAYLADTGRTLSRPPAGPVPGFAYGSALFWDFVVLRLDAALIDAMLRQLGEREPLATLADELAARDDSLAAVWLDFVAANLATGPRAGALPGHPYAALLDGITAEQTGPRLDDDERFYGMSARYYRIDHPGGPLWFGLTEPAPGLELALHPVDAGAADGPVLPAAVRWDAATAGPRDLGERPAGGYWLSVANPIDDAAAIKAHLCTADAADALTCVTPPGEDPDPTESDPTESDPGDPDPTTTTADPNATESDPGGCRTTAEAPAWWLLLLALPRRRRVRR